MLACGKQKQLLAFQFSLKIRVAKGLKILTGYVHETTRNNKDKEEKPLYTKYAREIGCVCDKEKYTSYEGCVSVKGTRK